MTNSELYLNALMKKEIKKMLKEGVIVTPTVIRTQTLKKLREKIHYSSNAGRVQRGLDDARASVRKAWAKRMNFTPTPEQVQKGLDDKNDSVREAWAKRMDYKPTPEQIQKGLDDKYTFVRLAWVERTDYTSTTKQIQKGLDDKDWLVRRAWAKRMDYKPTPAQIQKGLDDVNKSVREAWVKRMDYKPTPAQIQKGLDDEEWPVRKAWAERTDYTPTPEQRQKGLDDKNPYVWRVWAKRTDKTPTKEQVQEGEEVDPKIEDELEKVLGDAAKKFAADMGKVGKDAEQKLQDEDEVEKVLQQNPDIKKLAKESVTRRGRTLTERGQLNEELLSVSFLVGLSLAIPSLVGLIGSIVKIIEGKLGSKTEMGDKLKHIGHEMHEGIIKYITNGLKLIPGFSKLKPETQKKISTVVHIIIVAYLAIHSGGVAIESVKSGLEATHISTSIIEGALAAVKSGEVASFLKKTILAVVGS